VRTKDVKLAVQLLHCVFLLGAMAVYAVRLRRAKPDNDLGFWMTGVYNAEACLAVVVTVFIHLKAWRNMRRHTVSVIGVVLWLACVSLWIDSSVCDDDFKLVDFASVSALQCNYFTGLRCPTTPDASLKWYVLSAVAVLMHGAAGAATAHVVTALASSGERLLGGGISMIVAAVVVHVVVDDMLPKRGPYVTHHVVMLGVLGICFASLVRRWWALLQTVSA
jgi:hypothetical protein